VQGTANIVSTDASGHFSLELPTGLGSTLVAGYAGYEDQTLKVGPSGTAPITVNLRLTPAAASKGPARALRTGDLAPDFTLPTTTGTLFKLSAHRGHPVVLYFYPKDGSSGCTKEACSFRDQYQDFTDLGAEVIGISSDDELSHQQFTQKYQLPFPLLTDAGGQLRKQYAVPRAALGLLPGRVTYVLDGEGRVRYVFNSLSEATSHVLNAKEILRDIR
jgi:peroxiredoxin Q/BCP